MGCWKFLIDVVAEARILLLVLNSFVKCHERGNFVYNSQILQICDEYTPEAAFDNAPYYSYFSIEH
jgi:hypothetical protein